MAPQGDFIGRMAKLPKYDVEILSIRKAKIAVFLIALIFELLRFVVLGCLWSLIYASEAESFEGNQWLRRSSGGVCFLLTCSLCVSSAIVAITSLAGTEATGFGRIMPCFYFITLLWSIVEVFSLVGFTTKHHDAAEMAYARLAPIAWAFVTASFIGRCAMTGISFASWKSTRRAINAKCRAESRELAKSGRNLPGAYATRAMQKSKFVGNVSQGPFNAGAVPTAARQEASTFPPTTGAASSSPPLATRQFSSSNSRGRVKSTIWLKNLDHAELHKHPELLETFTTTIKEAIAKEAGHGLSSAHVEVHLTAGSVIVDSTITPPTHVCHHSVHSVLEKSPTLVETILDHVQNVPDIKKVSQGTVHVSHAFHAKESSAVGGFGDATGSGTMFHHSGRCAAAIAASARIKKAESVLREEIEALRSDFRRKLTEVEESCRARAQETEQRISNVEERAKSDVDGHCGNVRVQSEGGDGHSRTILATNRLPDLPSDVAQGRVQSAHENISSAFLGATSFPPAMGLKSGNFEFYTKSVAANAEHSKEIHGLRYELQSLKQKFEDFVVKLDDVVGSAKISRQKKIEFGCSRLKQDLVKSLVFPPVERNAAQRLALHLLRQSCEVSALILAGPANCASHVASLQVLRSKYKSAGELREIARHVMTEHLREILSRPSAASQGAVVTALMNGSVCGSPWGAEETNSGDNSPVASETFEWPPIATGSALRT